MPPVLLLLLLTLLLLLVVSIISASLGKDIREGRASLEKPCPPHKWEDKFFKDQYGDMKWSHYCVKCKKWSFEINNSF